MLIMFWQNPAAVSGPLFRPETGGWPISDRYRLTFVMLGALLTSTISSFGGTSATGAAWLLAADNSFRACDVPGVPPIDRSGASNEVQPSVGLRNAASSLLSLPLTTFVAPARAALLAALDCAVCPVAVSR